MPKRNQKKIGEEEQKKIKEGQAKMKKELELAEEELTGIKKELFEEEKKKLPDVLKNKTDVLVNELKQKTKLDYARLYSLIAKKETFANKNVYSDDELILAFQEFQGMVNLINEKQQFVPTKNLFCAYIGVSTSTYDSWLASGDDTRREVVQRVDDYLADVSLSLAQQRKIDSYTTIYRAKAQHNIIEKNAPIVVEYKKSADLDEIKDRLSMFKKGKVIDAEYNEKGGNKDD